MHGCNTTIILCCTFSVLSQSLAKAMVILAAVLQTCEQQSSILHTFTDHAYSPWPSLPPLLIFAYNFQIMARCRDGVKVLWFRFTLFGWCFLVLYSYVHLFLFRKLFRNLCI